MNRTLFMGFFALCMSGATALILFTGGMAVKQNKALGQCMNKGYTEAHVTLSGTYCKKWTTSEGQTVVPLISN